MYEAAIPRRPRRRRPLRAALLLGVVGLLVCCLGAAGLGLWNMQAVLRAAQPARQAAEEFLARLVAGDTTGAYDRLCTATRQRWTPDGFGQQARHPSRITGFEIADVSVTTRDGRPRADVAVLLHRESGRTDERNLPVVVDGDGWRVCGDPF